MRFRTGLIIGLGVGYYYGAKAGHQRYREIEEWLDKVRSTTTYGEVRTKALDGWREATTAARRLIDESAGGGRAPIEGTTVLDDDLEAFDVDRGGLDGRLRARFSDPTLN